MKNDLKEVRVKLGLTQQMLAEKLNMSESYYCRIERGSVIPGLKTGIDIAKSLRELYFEKTGKYPENITVETLFYD